jgi:hypothetical protein
MTDPIRAIVPHNRWMTVLLPLFITTALLSYHFSSLFYCRPIATCNHCFCWNYSSLEHCHFSSPGNRHISFSGYWHFSSPGYWHFSSPGNWHFSSPFCCPFPSAFIPLPLFVTFLFSYFIIHYIPLSSPLCCHFLSSYYCHFS